MNEWPAIERTAYAAVDEALQSYPLAPAPAALAPAVLARVRGLAAPRFRLVWLDYALSLFAAGTLGLALWLCQATPAWLALRLQVQLSRWSYYTPPVALWGALASGLGLALTVLVVGGVVLLRPRRFR